jgi:hypothetical protein
MCICDPNALFVSRAVDQSANLMPKDRNERLLFFESRLPGLIWISLQRNSLSQPIAEFEKRYNRST